MKRLVAILGLACVLAQIPLPFFSARVVQAADLKNVLPTNITPPKDEVSADKQKNLEEKKPLIYKAYRNDYYSPDDPNTGQAGSYDPSFLKSHKQLRPSTNSDIYPINDQGSPGEGYLRIDNIQTTSFGGVATITIDVANINQTAETNDLWQAIFGSLDEPESSTHGAYLIIGTDGRQQATGKDVPDGLFGYDVIKTAADSGFTQTYTPRHVISSPTGWWIPELTGTITKSSNVPSQLNVTAYNIKQYLIRQKDKIQKNTQFTFQVPFYLSDPNKAPVDLSKNQYYAQIFVDENAGGGENKQGLSREKSFQLLPPKNAATQDWGTFDSGKKIEEQLTDTAAIANAEAQKESQAQVLGEMLNCSWYNPVSWFTDCMVMAFYTVIYRPTAFLLEVSAKLMDMFIGFSISNFFYGDTITFIGEGWKIVRDVSNILFIFILLWTAFNIILKVNHHFNANKVIVQLIIIGLLINFSLFFTRVIIDGGNIMARVFYNAITTVGDDDFSKIQGSATKPQIKSLSGGISDGMQITRILSDDVSQKILAGGGGAGFVFLLLVLGVIMNIVAAWTFVQSAFFFIGRIITLWVAMIFAPFAFTTTILHELHVPKIGWNEWIKNLLQAAFGAGFFLFFIFLILKFINSKFLEGIASNYGDMSSGTILAVVVLQFLFIIGLIKYAKNIAQMMAGEFGGALAGAIEGVAKFAGGAAIGIASGGVALAGSRLIGGRAASWLNSADGNMHKLASAGDQNALNSLKNSNLTKYGNMSNQQLQKIAQAKVQQQQKMAKASFDVRNTGAGNLLTLGTGINLNAAADLGKLTGIGALKSTDVGKTAGGFQSAVDRKAAKQKEYLDSLNLNDEEKKKLDEELKELTEALQESKKTYESTVNKNEAAAKQLLERIQAKGGKGTAAEQTELAGYQKAINDAKEKMDRKSPNADAKIKDLADTIETKKAAREQVSKSAMRMYQDFLQREHLGHDKENIGDAVGSSWANSRNIFYQKSFLQGLGQLGKNLPKAILEGIKTGIVGTPIAGLGGALAGVGVALDQALTGGGFLKSFKKLTVDEFAGARRVEQQALHALAAGHVHEPHPTVIYKSPNENIFNIFKSSGGGGGSHGHGGGGSHGHGGGGHH